MSSSKSESTANVLEKSEVDSLHRRKTNFEAFTPNKKQKPTELKYEKGHALILNDQDYIMKPHRNDVLGGRGHFSHNHDGNAYFRRLVKSYKMDYVSSSKKQKKIYSKIIYDKIRKLDPPGRFLKFEASVSKWRDIGEKKAIEKARQALREGAPDLINTMQETKSAAESILLLKGQECYDAVDSVECDTDSQQSSSTVSDIKTSSVAKMNEIDVMYSLAKSSFPTTEEYAISTIESEGISRKRNSDECVVTRLLSSNSINLKTDNYNFKTNALPGPRINPTRYF